jgi:SAM-dependent methyltransferase
MADDDELRRTFDTNAEAYAVFRPRYPEALFEHLVSQTALAPDASLLEIGPGTGQATKPMAARGYRITAVELGSSLAEAARRTLSAYPNVQILTGSFEDTPLPPETFDLIYAATAFHWIPDDIKFARTHRLLKPRGHLAVIHAEHVSDEEGDEFFFASQPIYRKYTSSGSPANQGEDFRLPLRSSLKPPTLDGSLFELQDFRSFPMSVSYSAHAYRGLLSTHSSTIALPPDRREGFLHQIEQLIDARFDGSVTKHSAMTLTIARKRSASRPGRREVRESRRRDP